MRCSKRASVLNGPVQIWKVSLSHTTSRLILIRARRNHKGGKTLPHNILYKGDYEEGQHMTLINIFVKVIRTN